MTAALVNRFREKFTAQDGSLYSKYPGYGGRPLGSIKQGYLKIIVDGRNQLIHRIIFALHYGWLPDQVDHIDLDKTNNRIENLRAATNQQNQCNRVSRRGHTGIRGVLQGSISGAYLVKCSSNGKAHYGGTFHSIEEADAAARCLRDRLHGIFANHSVGKDFK